MWQYDLEKIVFTFNLFKKEEDGKIFHLLDCFPTVRNGQGSAQSLGPNADRYSGQQESKDFSKDLNHPLLPLRAHISRKQDQKQAGT